MFKSQKKVIASLVVALLTVPAVILATNPNNSGEPGAVAITKIPDIMKAIARAVWQLTAGLAVIMFIVAGIFFVSSNGEPGKITKAKDAVIWGVVGIIVATMAYGVVQVVTKWVSGAS